MQFPVVLVSLRETFELLGIGGNEFEEFDCRRLRELLRESRNSSFGLSLLDLDFLTQIWEAGTS